MLQRLSCAHLCFRNVTIAILYCLVLHSISSSYFRRFKMQLLGLLFKFPRVEHTSPLLHYLHWLPVQQRIKYKVCSICYASLTGTSPTYMSELVNVYIPSRCLYSLSDSHILTILNVKPRPIGSVPLLIKDQIYEMTYHLI